MRLSKCIPLRRVPAPGRAAIPFGAMLALLLAGCAGDSEYREASWYDDGRKVVMEDDGMPAQTPPLRRTKSVPDDPAEPFSPNYGPPALPDDLPATFRRKVAGNVG